MADIAKEMHAIRSDSRAVAIGVFVGALIYIGAMAGAVQLGPGGFALAVPGVLIGTLVARIMSGRHYSAFERDQDVRITIVGTIFAAVVVGLWVAYKQGVFNV